MTDAHTHPMHKGCNRRISMGECVCMRARVCVDWAVLSHSFLCMFDPRCHTELKIVLPPISLYLYASRSEISPVFWMPSTGTRNHLMVQQSKRKIPNHNNLAAIRRVKSVFSWISNCLGIFMNEN